MRINYKKFDGDIVQIMIERAIISRDIDASEIPPFAVKRVVLQQRMIRILQKYFKPLLKLLLYLNGALLVALVKTLIKIDLHPVTILIAYQDN